MKVQYQPKPQFLLSTFLICFIINANQVGIGIFGYQRIIFFEAKHDAWISVVLAGVFSHIVVFIMIKTLQIYGSTDLYGIHQDVYGKWIGKMLSSAYILYCLCACLIILKNYIEVIQTWVYPTVPTWVFSFSILLLVIYGVTGGIRIIVGVCFFSILFSLWMFGLIGFPLRLGDFHHLLPVMETNMVSLLKGVHKMTFTIVGFEILYFVYPFLEKKDRVQKFAQLGIAATTFLYLIIMLLTISYFSPGQLEHTIWATLTLFKIVRLSFIERTEYIAVSYWLLIILPNLMLYLWAAVHGVKRTFGKKPKGVLWIFILLIFVASLFFTTRLRIDRLNDTFAKFSFFIVFCYPFVLYAFALLKKQIRSYKEKVKC
ncbi:GerAB/ArcD/ProY family transporter [Bacillus sp. OK048]|uniref:GerAB/ArcD/ProY family transporter n=1 Tax=Bacillus sp. OK048 TaxID=1882761 RepID=UPI000882B11A|nr:GerAB/ArcD/ProY family transporter [Bacillus sp. OK048]SDN41547.1 spore germination protein (amino acid permease) [Bacillus sp. OK048]